MAAADNRRIRWDIEKLMNQGRLETILGAVEALAKKLQNAQTGKLDYLGTAEKRGADRSYDLLGIPGLGPKRSQRCSKNLACTVSGTREAAQNGDLRALEGLEKSLSVNICGGSSFVKNQWQGSAHVAYEDSQRLSWLYEKMYEDYENRHRQEAYAAWKKQSVTSTSCFLKRPETVMEHFISTPSRTDLG